MNNNASAYIFIYNEKGEMLLQLRAADDYSYPLHYDFSAAGGIEPGEDHETAAHRELKEELGVETELTYIGEDEYEGETMYLYKGVLSDGFNPGEEVEDIRFASTSEIAEMIEAGEKFHPEFVYLFKKMFQ